MQGKAPDTPCSELGAPLGAPHPWSSTVSISSALRRGRVASPSAPLAVAMLPSPLGAGGSGGPRPR